MLKSTESIRQRAKEVDNKVDSEAIKTNACDGYCKSKLNIPKRYLSINAKFIHKEDKIEIEIESAKKSK